MANSGNLPKNKSTLLGPVNGKENQNYSKTLIRLRDISHDTQGAEGEKETVLITAFLQRKEKRCECAENVWGR
jgi:hypothetical protein